MDGLVKKQLVAQLDNKKILHSNVLVKKGPLRCCKPAGGNKDSFVGLPTSSLLPTPALVWGNSRLGIKNMVTSHQLMSHNRGIDHD